MNCHPPWVTQNAIPGEQELILLEGWGSPPPDKVGLRKTSKIVKPQNIEFSTTLNLQLMENHNKQFSVSPKSEILISKSYCPLANPYFFININYRYVFLYSYTGIVIHYSCCKCG